MSSIEESWKKKAEAAMRSLYRWQHNEMIKSDFVDENGDVVGDPYLERDRAIAQYLEARIEIADMKMAYEEVQELYTETEVKLARALADEPIRVQELRQQIADANNERDRAIAETVEQCAQVCDGLATKCVTNAWVYYTEAAEDIRSKFAHIAQREQPSADPSASPSERSAKVTRQDAETAEGTQHQDWCLAVKQYKTGAVSAVVLGDCSCSTSTRK